MGNWRSHPHHQGWQAFVPDHLDDWPAEAPERCRCWNTGCTLTRHRVPIDGASADPEAADERPWRYEIFHARPIPVPKPERPEKRDHRRLAAGDR